MKAAEGLVARRLSVLALALAVGMVIAAYAAYPFVIGITREASEWFRLPQIAGPFRVPAGGDRHGLRGRPLASSPVLHSRTAAVRFLVRALPADPDRGEDPLRMGVQRHGRERLVDGVAACVGQCLVRDSAARSCFLRCGVAGGGSGLRDRCGDRGGEVSGVHGSDVICREGPRDAPELSEPRAATWLSRRSMKGRTGAANQADPKGREGGSRHPLLPSRRDGTSALPAPARASGSDSTHS